MAIGAVAMLVLVPALIGLMLPASDGDDGLAVCVDEPNPAPRTPLAEREAVAIAPAAAPPGSGTPETVWRTIACWSGSGPKQTQRFETSGTAWRIAWKTLWGGPSSGCFSIRVYSDAGEFVTLAASRVGASSDVSLVNAPAGTYFLDVTSFCQEWELVVEEPETQYGLAEPQPPTG